MRNWERRRFQVNRQDRRAGCIMRRFRRCLMEPTEELMADIRSARLARARRMSAEEKLVSGPRLFALAVECMRAGIRLQHPEADQRRVQELVSQRIARLREKDERPMYGPG